MSYDRGDDPPLFPIDPFLRKQEWKSCGKGPTGRSLCYSGCGREVAKGRRSTCSRGCGRAWEIRNVPGVIRQILKGRDNGVCAICKQDTALQAQIAREYYGLFMWFAMREKWRIEQETKESLYYWWCETQAKEQLKERGMFLPDAHLWEADHIIPVIEGGGGCTPDGYRTLCLKCHRDETAKLAARRATKRRAAKQPELQL